MVSFFFVGASYQLMSVQAPVLIKLRYTAQVVHEVRIPRLFGFFHQDEIFESYKSVACYDCYYAKHFGIH